MRNRFVLVVLLGVCFWNSGCRELVSGDFPQYEKTPVFSSVIKVGNNINVHLSYVADVNAAGIEVVENAKVALFVNGVFTEYLSYAGDGLYESSVMAAEENSYGFEVEIPGYDTITCESHVPKSEEIINVTHIEKAGIDNEGTTYPGVKILFTNNIEEERYYEVVIKLFRDEYASIATLEKIVDPVLLYEGLPIAVFSNSAIPGETYELTLNYTTGHAGSSGTTLFPLVVELRTVSEDYYKYVKQLYLYEIGRYPDGPGSANNSFRLYSNVKNGHGIVVAYSYTATDTIYP